MTKYHYDKDEIKSSLTIEDVMSLVAHFGGDPVQKGVFFVAGTICHNAFGEGSHKLYYYDNTSLFKCYTNCDVMDIFELVIKIKAQEGEVWSLPQAMAFVAKFFNIEGTLVEEKDRLDDWKVLNNYDRIADIDLETQKIKLKSYERDTLKHYPQPRIIPWEQEGISRDVSLSYEIAYNPMTGGILIPHFDIDGDLIGIRERTLVKENETRGKYLPSIINGVQYSHPLSYNLYGLNKSKENIQAMKTAIVVEAEKSVLLYNSYFGIENSIICATCGGNLINYQAQVLMDLGVKEIVVGFDKDFVDKEDPNFLKVVNKLKLIEKKYGAYVQVSFLFDKEDLLSYKQSPLDAGKEVFLELYKNRIIL